MKSKFLLLIFSFIFCKSIIAQTTFTFNGNGLWTDSTNWVNNKIPPNILSAGLSIIINPSGSGTCILNVPQIIDTGAVFSIIPGKNFKTLDDVIINDPGKDSVLTDDDLSLLDSSATPNPTLADILGPDGTALGRPAALSVKDYLISNMITYGQVLCEEKTNTIHQNPGGQATTPTHAGLAYRYGGSPQKNIFDRLFPDAGSAIHRQYAVYGTDCTGFLINLIRNEGITIEATNSEGFAGAFKIALANDPRYSTVRLVKKAYLPKDQLITGDIIYWPLKKHIGIVLRMGSSDEVKMYNSHGDPFPASVEQQAKNWGLNRGVHALSYEQVIYQSTTNPGRSYWGKGYQIFRLEDITNQLSAGDQTWAAKNLDVSRYRNGDTIPQVTDPDAWSNLTTGAWCYYNNDPLNGTLYGKLYNGYAVMDPRGLAPQGWHVPTDEEWKALVERNGGQSDAGAQLKATGNYTDGTGLWKKPNTNATNGSAFTGLPGGARTTLGNTAFTNLTITGYWWTSTPFSVNSAWYRSLYYGGTTVSRLQNPLTMGFSVRCVKN